MGGISARSGAGRAPRRYARFLVGMTLTALLMSNPSLASAQTGSGGSRSAAVPANGYAQRFGVGGESDVNVCSDAVATGLARCFARVRTDSAARSRRPPAPGAVNPAAGLGNGGAYDPAFLQSAYATPSETGGSGQTVAIVDAFDDPNAASDLAAYRAFFGLPPCTADTGCFRKIDQYGGSSFPAPDVGWSQEISLDVDMVSAICPGCHILLVEAASNSFNDLGTAVNTAVALGANVVSNSYGGTEFSNEAAYSNFYFNHPGVAIVVSSGDSGYGVQFPAASQYVTAVGGTHLVQNTDTGTRNGAETAWAGAGSGCSSYEAKPSWQKDLGCSRRTVADVSAVADPTTPVWVYDSYGGSPWQMFGGTSTAAPIVGAVYALAGNQTSNKLLAAVPYAAPTALNDVTSGSNGTCATYLCTAGVSYDGPTGLGTPIGAQAFTATTTQTAPAAPVFTAASPPNSATAGTTYSYSFAATGSPAPAFALASGNLPGGLNLNPSTGVLSGTPTTNGLFSFTVKASNAVAPDAVSGSITINVNVGPLNHLVLSPATSVIAAGASRAFTATGADVSGNSLGDVTASTTLTIAPSGAATGASCDSTAKTCTAISANSYTVTGSYSGKTGTALLTVPAPVAAPAFTAENPPTSATAGTGYSYTFAATGNPAPTFAKSSGTLPDGLSLNPSSGALSGTPAKVGSFTFAVKASNGVPPDAQSASVTIVVSPAKSAGYRLIASDGGIFAFGNAAFYGSTGAVNLTKPIVGMTATPDGHGYWLVASDGGIFAFGNAAFYGSTGAVNLTKPIVGMAATPDGHGYWLVASDGGIFAFGNAAFYGSTGAVNLNKPIVGMTATPDGHGYWLVASDGGIFAFGNAAFYGSTGAVNLTKPIVGMTATPDGHGYWLVASDGGIFAFGNAAFYGSTGAVNLTKPIVGMTATPDGHGYWLVASDGGIFAFGNAAFYGSTGAVNLTKPIVGMTR